MNLRVAGAFVYFTIPIFGGIPITQTTVSHLLVTVILCCGCIYCGKNLKKQPSRKQILVEKGVMLLRNMVAETMGAHNTEWTPFIGTIFLSSLCGSFIGLTGFLRASTADLSCTLVWSLMVTGLIWHNNIKNQGFAGWLKGFTQPIAVLTPMNVISEIAQPISMAFRHFGNIAGGGVITSLIYTALSLASTAVLNLICANGYVFCFSLLLLGMGMFWLRKKRSRKLWLAIAIACFALGLCGLLQVSNILPNIPILSLGIPGILSCYFDIFSGFIQAYVFTLLTMVYISASLPAPQAESV